MSLRRWSFLCVALAIGSPLAVPARAQSIFGGESLLERFNPFPVFDPAMPVDVIALSKQIDCISEKLRNDGLVIVKQPDVYSQARMTRFRKDFDGQMQNELGNFHLVLAARIGRLDSATTTQTTSLAAALAAPGTTNLQVATPTTGAHAVAGAASPAGAAAPAASGGPAIPTPPAASFGTGDTLSTSGTAFSTLGLDTNMASVANTAAKGTLSLGVDPTVYLDEKQRFLDHLNQIRRINMGPDQNDSSGYGLYLVRLPVSITPGECTYQGYGAELAVSVEHEFPPDFLHETFRDLVINDLVDQLTPVVFEVIRSGCLARLAAIYERNTKQQKNGTGNHSGIAESPPALAPAPDGEDDDEVERQKDDREVGDLLNKSDFRTSLNLNLASTRTPKQMYPIAPREVINFFLPRNIYLLAKDAQQALITQTPRMTDVRSYLRHSLYIAYDAMATRTARSGAISPPLNYPELMDCILEAVKERQFEMVRVMIKGHECFRSPLQQLNDQLIERLEIARDHLDQHKNEFHQPIAALCWAIAIDAALLDAALHQEIPKVLGPQGINFCPPPTMHFYFQDDIPDDGRHALFNDFVRYKWPVVTFALDPMTDQQNVADSFNLKRDLQLALSYAFSTGQINFSQLNTFRRQIEQSSDTIALNRTVTGFTHGNDTFAFRFTPRFQNPPNQRTNIGVIASQLIGGGPGPDYQTKKSKLEPGMRELTAIILLPTFLPCMRMQISSNWFKLTDPEHLVFHSKRMLVRGRQYQELRQAVVHACTAQQYRDADLRVLQAKLQQLERILPAQSTVVQLPFECTASGFDVLFSRGSTALVPELTGYDAADYVLQNKNADIYLYGKYISILDTKVIVGGAIVPDANVDILSREVVHIQVPTTANPTVTEDGKTYYEVYLATPNGISNRVLVPCLTAPAPAQVAFDLDSKTSPELDIFYQWIEGADGKHVLIATQDPSGAAAGGASGAAGAAAGGAAGAAGGGGGTGGSGGKKTINITWDSPTGMAPKTLQATFTAPVNGQNVNFSVQADSGSKDSYSIDPQQITLNLLGQLQNIVAYPTLPPASLSVTIQVQPYIPMDSMGYRVISTPKQLKTPLTIKLVPNVTNANALEGVRIVPQPPPPATKPSAQRTTSDDHIRTVSQIDFGQTVTTVPLPAGINLPSGTVPSVSAAVTSLTGGIPPIPPIPPTPTLLNPTTATSTLTSLGATITNNTPAAALSVPLPPIIVNPSPLLLIAPPSAPASPKPHRFRLFSHNRNNQAAPAQPPR